MAPTDSPGKVFVGEQGHPIRATVSEMGPLLLSRLLGLNETQEGVLNIAFRVADEQGLLLLDLKDLRSLLQLLAENAQALTATYGNVSKASVGAIQRQLLLLENQRGGEFLGEPALDIKDLMRTDRDGRGVVNILSADKLMNNPRLYATFLLWLMSELFEELPEVGDLDQPKLVFFFDEAHLLFDEATDTFLESVERTVRMIRSKGVGVFFVTQHPTDIPGSVLAQLGNRIQHALRAFTPNDADALRKTVKTYPISELYDLEQLLTSLGIGEAAVTVLDEKGVPTPVVHTRLRAPRSSMEPAPDLEQTAKASMLWTKYGTRLERETAAEALARRVESIPEEPDAALSKPRKRSAPPKIPRDPLTDFMTSRQGKAIQRELVRGMFGMLRKRL